MAEEVLQKPEPVYRKKKQIYWGINRIFLVGYVVSEVFLKKTSAGALCAYFGLVVNGRGYRDDTTGEYETESNYFKVVLYGNYARSGKQFIRKGNLLCVEGKMKQWKKKFEEDRRYDYQVVVSHFALLPGKLGKKESAKDAKEMLGTEGQEIVIDSDMGPFG